MDDNHLISWNFIKASFAMDVLIGMRTFVEVVQAGSMNAAAQKLNVTGALVGQRIVALEDHLGVRLLNRSTRRQSLTDFGTTYFEQCRDILELVAVSEGKASDEQLQPQGRLRIAAPVSFGNEALMPVLGEFTETMPDVEIDVILSDQNEDLVAHGVDVTFRIGELQDSSMLQRPLAPYRMAICAAPDYLERFGTPQHPRDLDLFQAVLFSRTGRKPWRFSRGTEQFSWIPRTSITVNAGQAVRVAAAAGTGIAMLPEALVKADFAAGKLTWILPDWLLPQRPMSLVYHRDRYMPRRLSCFLEFAMSRFGK